MQLTRLEINGFRGLYRTFDLSGDTIITAGNGRGKTTVLCALLWLLCGVDDEDKANYNIFDNKLPQDDPSQPLQASVTGYFDTITISRGARQKWNKDGVRKGDEYTYAINDMEVSATRFNEIIEQNFMPIPLLKFALNIRRWELIDERVLRDQIRRLASDDNKPTDSKYDVIQWAISENGIDGAKKHFSKRRREYEDAAKNFAASISATKSMLPEVKDADEMETELAAALTAHQSVESRIHAVIPTDVIAKRQAEEQAIYEKNAAYLQAKIKYESDIRQQISEAKNAWEHACLARSNNKARRESLKALKASLSEANIDRQRLVDELTQCRKRRFTGICPTCGQELQGSSREEKLKAFKSQKESDEARIVYEGGQVKDRIVTLEASIDKLQQEIIAEKEADTVVLERTCRLLEARYAIPFADTDEAKALQAELDELKANRTEVLVNAESEADKVLRGELLMKIERLRSEIAVAKNNAVTAEKLQTAINELGTKRQAALRRMGESETALQRVKEYETEWAHLLQDDINSRFNKIRIRMSDVTKSGEIIDCCKVEMANVADTLNTASRVVAGIEISLAFQRKYGVSLPMVVDNAESVERERIDTDGRQVILMYMREGQELEIKKA